MTIRTIALTVAASAAILALGGCKPAEEAKQTTQPSAWEQLTTINLPVDFNTGLAASNFSVSKGYLNNYSGSLSVASEASTLNGTKRRTFDFGTSATAWEDPASGGWTPGAQSLGFDIATDVTNGRVEVNVKKVNFGTLTASSGISFDLELPVNNAGFIAYLRQCDSTGTVVKTYTMKINGGFDAKDDWNWYWNPGDHWNTFKLPLAKFMERAVTASDTGGSNAAADLASFTPNMLTLEFRLDTGSGNGVDVDTKEKAWFDNLAVY